VVSWAPHRGDVVWLSFEPVLGHEQAGHRPALVLSPRSYNRRSGLCLACPITSVIKGYPFEVPIGVPLDRPGVVLADQVRAVDWQARRAKPAGRAPAAVHAAVLAKLSVLLLEAGTS
jgi:mRNA interferase MazF